MSQAQGRTMWTRPAQGRTMWTRPAQGQTLASEVDVGRPRPQCLRGWLASRARTLPNGEALCSTVRKLPDHHDTGSLGRHCKAVERQQAGDRSIAVSEEGRPVIGWHIHVTILRANTLHAVADGRRCCSCLDVGLRRHERPPRHHLQEAEAPVRSELGVAGHHVADAGILVQTSRDAPHQVAHHVIARRSPCSLPSRNSKPRR